jgi:hypothetical protein
LTAKNLNLKYPSSLDNGVSYHGEKYYFSMSLETLIPNNEYKENPKYDRPYEILLRRK